MDLSKIIGELKVELQVLDTAIASMEELARVQNLAEMGSRPVIPSETDSQPAPTAEQPQERKRKRGRPRKEVSAAGPEESEPMEPEAPNAGDDVNS